MDALKEGTLLQGGKYKVIRFISAGGFGCTYEGSHVNLKKRVAIKEFFVKDFCNRDAATSHVTVGITAKMPLVKKLKAKFWEEAQAVCSLEHPHIVKVTDVFEENGTAYYVMDYIDGMSLNDMVTKYGPLSEKQAVDYIRQVAEALRFVHSRNRLHLDIKPGNIMVDGKGNAILIDFGASKQYDEEAGENTSTVLGCTPGYAPPEQKSNDIVRFMPSTDIYALGATLYKLLTGITPLDTNRLVSGETLEPLPAGISEGVRQAISQAMQLNKMMRPQSIDAFLELLDGTEEEGSKGEDDGEKDKDNEDEKGDVVEEDTDVEVTVVDVEESKKKEVADNPPEKESDFTIILRTVCLAIFGLAMLVGLVYVGMNWKRWLKDATKPEFEVKNECLVCGQPTPLCVYRGIHPKCSTCGKVKDYCEYKGGHPGTTFDVTVNGVTFKMIGVEGGTFTMGATSEQGNDAESDEKPAHSVTLSGYSIGETEVTQALWEAVMGSNPRYFKGPQKPVEQVSWDDCQTFISKLNSLTGQRFCLPTEAEWEYASRGGNKSRGYKYSGSNTLGNVAWYYDNSGGTTHDVKTKSPNELGIYDMSGNVWEWCQDWYGTYSSSSQTNPAGASSGSNRVCRGGGRSYTAAHCRAANRDYDTPSRRNYCLGFRLASSSSQD